MATQLWAVMMIVIGGLVGALGPIFLKKGMDNFSIKSIFKNFNLFLGISIYSLATLSLIIAFKGGDLTVLYPLIAISYIWVCLYSKVFLKEKMNLFKWLGIIIILLGISFIGMGA